MTIATILNTVFDTFLSTSFWIKTFSLIASFSILVFVHELGHYMWARIFGMRVLRFALFFNPWYTIYKWKPKSPNSSPGDDPNNFPDGVWPTWRDTEYALGWLPLGGYCSIAGMIDETQGTDQLSTEPKSWEFRAKPAWQRLIVMLGGVVNNFLLALVIYSAMVYTWGEMVLPMNNATLGFEFSENAHRIGFRDGDIPFEADGKVLHYFDGKTIEQIAMAKQVKVRRDGHVVSVNIPEKYLFVLNRDAEQGKMFITLRTPVVVDNLQPGLGAEKAGLHKVDRLIGVAGVHTPSFAMFTAELAKHKDQIVPLTVIRGTDTLSISAQVDQYGKLGFTLQNPLTLYKTETHTYSLLESIPRGISTAWERMTSYVKSLSLLFSKEGVQSLGSFGAIGSMFPASWQWYDFWSITAFLSIMLAVMNILPIPALDGGHVVFLLYEIIFRRKPSEKVIEKAQMVGMAILLVLMVFAFGNDIYKFFIR